MATARASAAWSGAGISVQPEHHAHQALHLVLVRPPPADDRLLHVLRGIALHGDAPLAEGQEHHAARVRHLHGAGCVLGEEQLLHPGLRRAVLREELPDRAVNLREALRKGVSGSVVTTPCATWMNREPSNRTTPHPVAASPGSIPITVLIHARGSGRDITRS